MSVQSAILTILLVSYFSNLNADNLLLSKETSPLGCNTLLEEFAKVAANFTMCSIQYARPIRLCEVCIDNYVKFNHKYGELMNKTENGTSCKDIYISRDRLDAVLEYYNNIEAIWTKGHCSDCFNWSGSLPVLSNGTHKFIRMFQETNECLSNDKEDEDICEKCMYSYLQLDEFYKTMSSDAIGVDSICMDVVDMMNTTRSKWSKELNCCKLRKTPEIIFLCCTAVISALPVLFYLAIRYCGPIRDLPNVLNRMGGNSKRLEKSVKQQAFLSRVNELKHEIFEQFSPTITKESKKKAWSLIRDYAVSIGLITHDKDFTYVRDATWPNLRNRTMNQDSNNPFKETGILTVNSFARIGDDSHSK